MGIQAPAEIKFGLIHEAIRNDGNTLNISELFFLFVVLNRASKLFFAV